MGNGKSNIMFVIAGMVFGGAERQLLELLKGIDRARFRPFLTCLSKSTGFTDDVKKMGIPILYAERKWRMDPFVIWHLAGLIRKNHIALVHSFMPLAGIYGSISARLSGVPIVNSAIRGTKQPSLYEKMLLRPTFALSNVILANSEAGKKVYVSLSPEKTKVVYNGIDLKRFDKREDGKKKKAELKLGAFKHVVTTVTRLEPVKGPLVLIKAARFVLGDNRDTAFLIVGDGSLRAYLEDVVRQTGLTDRVFFLGFRKDVEEILWATDVGVLTSNREGLPNAVLEMLASGVPVVATDCEGTREVLDDGETGFLAKIGDEQGIARRITELLKNDTLRREMGTKGKDVVSRKFNLSRMVASIEEIYDNLLESHA
jgi:glycosyltransferase involved in cell wall biosynthesis